MDKLTITGGLLLVFFSHFLSFGLSCDCLFRLPLHFAIFVFRRWKIQANLLVPKLNERSPLLGQMNFKIRYEDAFLEGLLAIPYLFDQSLALPMWIQGLFSQPNFGLSKPGCFLEFKGYYG